MALTLTLRGSKELTAALASMSQEIKEAVGNEVVATALELQGDVKRSIQRGPASGAVYQKYNPRRTHRASAPGQAPMSDTGRLANSITFDRQGLLTAVVGSALVYAAYLEYGTISMKARPFFRPAAEEVRPKFRKRLEDAVARATK